MTSLLTRSVCPDDAEAIVGILNPITEVGAFTAFDTPFSVDAEREYLTSCPARRVFQAEAREKGYEKTFTYVRADNDAALRVYQRHGFSIVGTARRHARTGGRYIDEIVIEKIFENE